MISRGRGRIIGLSLAASTLCMTISIELVAYRTVPRADPPTRGLGLLNIEAAISTESEGQRNIWFNEIVSHPLFNPNRRSGARSAGLVAMLPRLTAIVVDGSRRIAMFEPPSGSRATVVEIGSRIGIYDVRDIESDGMTVVGPQGTFVLHPTFDPAPRVSQRAALTAYQAFFSGHPAFFNVTAQ